MKILNSLKAWGMGREEVPQSREAAEFKDSKIWPRLNSTSDCMHRSPQLGPAFPGDLGY
jgi:hypothetical protein